MFNKIKQSFQKGGIVPHITIDTIDKFDNQVLEDSITKVTRIKRVFKFEDFRKVVKEMNDKGFRELNSTLEAEDIFTKTKIENRIMFY
jgi:hypothetical protein